LSYHSGGLDTRGLALRAGAQVAGARLRAAGGGARFADAAEALVPNGLLAAAA